MPWQIQAHFPFSFVRGDERTTVSQRRNGREATLQMDVTRLLIWRLDGGGCSNPVGFSRDRRVSCTENAQVQPASCSKNSDLARYLKQESMLRNRKALFSSGLVDGSSKVQLKLVYVNRTISDDRPHGQANRLHAW